jgi:CheY-like chemotaxis protein
MTGKMAGPGPVLCGQGIRDADGALTDAATIAKDLTDRLRAPVLAQQPAPGVAAAAKAVDSSVRVLIADDDADMRRLLQLILERSGEFTVVAQAADGREAIELARDKQPDLVLIDVRMPNLDGLSALPLLSEAAPSARLVVVSAFVLTRVRETAIERGADAYLEKTDLYKRLIPALKGVLGRPRRG